MRAHGACYLPRVGPRPSALVDSLRRALAGESSVHLAILFGSEARGTAAASSDVDLAVLGRDLEPLALGAALGRALGREVHVVSLVDPGVVLLEELVRDGIVVRVGAPGAGALWRSRALAQLETDRPWYARMRDAWLARVAREGIS